MIITIPINELKGGMVVLKFDKPHVPYAYFGKGLPSSSLKELLPFLESHHVSQAYVKVDDDKSNVNDEDSLISSEDNNANDFGIIALANKGENATVKIIPIEDLQGGMVVLKFDKKGVPYRYYTQPVPTSALLEVAEFLMELNVTKAYIKVIDKEPKKVQTSKPIIKVEKPISRNITAHVEDVAKQSTSVKQNVSPSNIDDVLESQKVHVRAKAITKDVLKEVRLGKAIDTDTARDVVSQLVDNCFKNPDAFVNMTRLKDFDDYTFTHSVNVSILAVSIGRRLGMNTNQLQNLGLAGLLHDIGKMKVPEYILNKPDKLTEEEFSIMKMHTVWGYEVLKKDSTIPIEVTVAARQHHEKADGSGYPDGVSDRNISKFAKILAIADVYDAVTSDRVYHKGLVPPEALKMIFSWSGKHFNKVLVKFFIDLIGIYPVGTLVLLDSRELAIVYDIPKDNARPKVVIVSDDKGEVIQSPYIFDLASYNAITLVPYKTILSAVSKENLNGIEPNKILSDFINTFKQ